MRKNSKIPMYVQIKDQISDEIEDGFFSVGDKLPSERVLSEQYSVSRMTARKALLDLQHEGKVEILVGSGTYVLKPKIKRDMIKLSGFSSMLEEKGIRPSNKLLSASIIGANRKIASKMDINIGESVYEIVRLRYGNEIPMALEKAYLPVYLFRDLLDYNYEEKSLYKTLEEVYTIDFKFAKQELCLIRSNIYEAKHFNILENEPMFLLEIVTYDKNDRCVEYVKSINRGDDSTFYTELWF